MSLRSSAVSSTPSNLTDPDVGSIRRSTQRPAVVLPLPDLADQTERLAEPDGERDVGDGLHVGA